MQREALIILAALLTVAVLAAGAGPEQTAEVRKPVVQDIAPPVADESMHTETQTIERQFGPVRFRVVGAQGDNNASLTLNLDVAI